MNRQLRRNGWEKVKRTQAAQDISNRALADKTGLPVDTINNINRRVKKANQNAADGALYEPVTVQRRTIQRICNTLELDLLSVVEPEPGEEFSESAVGQSQTDSVEGSLSFSSYISEKSDNFVGREYVFTTFDQFQKDYDKGYFSLVGDPGEGKSAIAAQLVNRNKGNPYCLYHFNLKKSGPNTAQQFLRNICSQLIGLFQLSSEIQTLETYEDGNYLREILDRASEQLQQAGRNLIIIVDALDEVVTQNSREEDSNVLYLPNILPSNVYFFITRRRDSKLEGRLDFSRDSIIFDFLSYDDDTDIGQGIIQDIQDYIRYYLNPDKYPRYADSISKWLQTNGATEDEFVGFLTKRSRRNFMYLFNVLPEFTPGGMYVGLSKAELKQLPNGLMEYYRDHWRRMGMTRPDSSALEANIIFLLTEVYEPVPVTIVAKFASVNLSREVRTDEVTKHYKRWKQFIHTKPLQEALGYLIYHESFNDFLQDEETIRNSKIMASRTRKDLNEAIWGDLTLDEQYDDDF